MPRKPDRSATRCFWLNTAGSLLQNTKAPDTAHSPGSAARSKTNVSDRSSRMVRGSFNMAWSSEFRAALGRIVPAGRGERIDEAAPRGQPAPSRANQQVAVHIDAAPHAGGTPRQPLQIIARDRLETALVPAVERGHQLARKPFDDGVGVDQLETFA